MRTIWKFPITEPESVIAMPKGSQILHIGKDERHSAMFPSIWAEVPEHDAETVNRTFLIIGTGHDMPMVNLKYLGTATSPGGQFVWHVFERLP